MIMKHAGFLQEDYENIDKKMNAQKIIRLADVADKIERIAFDVVRFRDSEGLDKLWVIQDNDGEQVLVAMYDDDQSLEPKTASAWESIADTSGVNVYYKGEPIKRLAMSSLGLSDEEAPSISRMLPAKLASDSDLTRSLLNGMSDTDRKVLFEKYPELKG